MYKKPAHDWSAISVKGEISEQYYYNRSRSAMCIVQ